VFAADSLSRARILGQHPTDIAESFVKHLEPVQRVLEAYCRRSLRDRSEVADVIQAAIASAYRDFHEFTEGTSFRAWIVRYVSLEVLNRNRSAARSRMGGLLADPPAADAAFDISGDEQAAMSILQNPERVFENCDEQIAEVIRDLPPLERSVLLLRAIGDFRYREIGEILSVPMGTVMGLLGRARARLRAQLAGYVKTQGWCKSPEGG
jgi:RNA polymerase sigma-70 factor (ECF subfamily)